MRYNARMTAPDEHIYLDHNATTPILPQAAEAVAAVYAAGLANPASQHASGREARQRLEAARDSIASLLGADCSSSRADRVVFTSGGTEANNLAILGLGGARPAHAIVSAIEHPSVAAAAEHLRRHGWQIDALPVTPQGVIDSDRLSDLLRPETRFVSLMLANNETGVVQPIAQAAKICAVRGILLHTDAVQAAGKLTIDFRRLGVAALSISAHKFGGPAGIGALVLRDDVPIAPLMHGGFQQWGLRPGTEPVALVAGMEAALAFWQRERDALAPAMSEARDEFEAILCDGWPGSTANGAAGERLPHVSNIALAGLDRQKLAMALDLAGVACATGSACASGSLEPSPTLVAMGCSRSILESSLRFSLGPRTAREDVLEAARRILKVCKGLQSKKMAEKTVIVGRREGPILVD
jgi:cysteine desulfurase